MASKKIATKPVMVRFPLPTFDRLYKIALARSAKERRRVGVAQIVMEAVQGSLN